jgi:hypothetical protein
VPTAFLSEAVGFFDGLLPKIAATTKIAMMNTVTLVIIGCLRGPSSLQANPRCCDDQKSRTPVLCKNE